VLAQEEPANIQTIGSDFPDFSSQQPPNGYKGLQAQLAGLAWSVVQP
jgi:hypothetical protein